MNEIEKAIEAIEIGMINGRKIQGWVFHEVRHEPLLTALAALREKQEREKGCEYCDDNFKFWQAQISGELPNVRFCPMCGRGLEVQHE